MFFGSWESQHGNDILRQIPYIFKRDGTEFEEGAIDFHDMEKDVNRRRDLVIAGTEV